MGVVKARGTARALLTSSILAVLLVPPPAAGSRNVGRPITDAVECFDPRSVPGEGTGLCVHWSRTGRNAPPGGDKDRDKIPNKIESVVNTLTQVWRVEVEQLGFKPPLGDAGTTDMGGTTDVDIYVKELSRSGSFGFCSSDDPASDSNPEGPVWAYCVVDNDFASTDATPTLSAKAARQVTIAHEFFHAIQFAYDFSEPLWFKEGSAVWVEDEVFPTIDDNYNYLENSPLRQPELSLDAPAATEGDLAPYGAWIFWRYLSERFASPIVRELWEAAGSPGIEISEALRQTVGVHDATWGDVFHDFGIANYLLEHPELGYRDGSAYLASLDGERPPFDAVFALTPERPAVEPKPLSIRSVATRYLGFGLAPARTLSLEVEPSASLEELVSTALVFGPAGPGGEVRLVPLVREGARLTVEIPAADLVVLVISNAGAEAEQIAYRASSN